MMHPVRHIEFTNELRFSQPREKVFEAFLDTEKWFQISYGEDRLIQLVNERRVGGQIYEDRGGTVLSHEFSAFGPMSDEMVEGIEFHASLATFEPQLRSWIEHGEVIAAPTV
jgi:hypothetical protein